MAQRGSALCLTLGISMAFLTGAGLCIGGAVLFTRRRDLYSGRAQGVITGAKLVRSGSCLYSYTFSTRSNLNTTVGMTMNTTSPTMNTTMNTTSPTTQGAQRTEYQGTYLSAGVLTCTRKVGDPLRVEYVPRDPTRSQASLNKTWRTLEGLEGLYVAMMAIGGFILLVLLVAALCCSSRVSVPSVTIDLV